jgi:hypothetical protein
MIAAAIHATVALLAVCTLIATSAAAAPPVPERPAQPRILLGAYAPPAPEQGLAPIETLERRLRRRIDIVLWYQHWAGWAPRLEREWLERTRASRRVPLLTWEPWSPGGVDQPEFRLRRIAEGAFDDYAAAWARGLKGYGRRVYLRPMHEMNGNWYPWGGSVNANSAADFVRAWRRLHGIFRRVGARNVRWVWSPYADDVPATPGNVFERYYPGRAYVDVLALDGYNWGGAMPQYGGWRSFNEIFGRAYRRLARLGPQPIWIAETASAPEGGDKAGWIRAMFASRRRYPRLRAIVWFNVEKERDWRATSPASAATAFAVGRRGAG